eukprot:9908513-Ditylum_brightwellii.AAC.1
MEFPIGMAKKYDPMPLPDFPSTAMHLIHTNQLFEGHKPFTKIITAQRVCTLQETVSQHISAASLYSLDPPTLLYMMQLCNHDKALQKSVYDEEYYGLQDLPAWSVIDATTYQKLKPIAGDALPSMAISTIKYDQD